MVLEMNCINKIPFIGGLISKCIHCLEKVHFINVNSDSDNKITVCHIRSKKYSYLLM